MNEGCGRVYVYVCVCSKERGMRTHDERSQMHALIEHTRSVCTEALNSSMPAYFLDHILRELLQYVQFLQQA